MKEKTSRTCSSGQIDAVVATILWAAACQITIAAGLPQNSEAKSKPNETHWPLPKDVVGIRSMCVTTDGRQVFFLAPAGQFQRPGMVVPLNNFKVWRLETDTGRLSDLSALVLNGLPDKQSVLIAQARASADGKWLVARLWRPEDMMGFVQLLDLQVMKTRTLVQGEGLSMAVAGAKVLVSRLISRYGECQPLEVFRTDGTKEQVLNLRGIIEAVDDSGEKLGILTTAENPTTAFSPYTVGGPSIRLLIVRVDGRVLRELPEVGMENGLRFSPMGKYAVAHEMEFSPPSQPILRARVYSLAGADDRIIAESAQVIHVTDIGAVYGITEDWKLKYWGPDGKTLVLAENVRDATVGRGGVFYISVRGSDLAVRVMPLPGKSVAVQSTTLPASQP